LTFGLGVKWCFDRQYLHRNLSGRGFDSLHLHHSKLSFDFYKYMFVCFMQKIFWRVKRSRCAFQMVSPTGVQGRNICNGYVYRSVNSIFDFPYRGVLTHLPYFF